MLLTCCFFICKVGDVIDIISKPAMGIWTGMLNGKIGNFKFIYVDMLVEECAPEPRIRSHRRSRRARPKTLLELLERLNLEVLKMSNWLLKLIIKLVIPTYSHSNISKTGCKVLSDVVGVTLTDKNISAGAHFIFTVEWVSDGGRSSGFEGAASRRAQCDRPWTPTPAAVGSRIPAGPWM